MADRPEIIQFVNISGMVVFVALTTHYGYVLLSAAVLAFECFLIGMLFAGGTRRKIFDEEYMKNHYGRIHTEATGDQITKGGYPDTGCGWYSRQLSYSSWYQFNNAQRAHYNFVESIAATTLMLIVGGLYQPIISTSVGLVMIIGRLAFAIGYTYSGPKGRTIGGILINLGYLALLVLACMSAVKMILGHSIG